MYNISSSKDGGTLVQLRNLTQRSLPQNSKSDVNTSDDFMDLIFKGLAATMTVLGIEDIDEIPSSLPSNLSSESSSKKKGILVGIVHEVVDKFVNIDLSSTAKKATKEGNEVYEYARETLSLLLLHCEFQDATCVC